MLRTDKKRNVITRASILATIGKTEENVREGLSIEDVKPFFEKHRLQLRVYDKFYKMVFKYDPPNRNHNDKTMYCMMTDGHIYTLNFDLDKIAQKDQDAEVDDLKRKVGDSFKTKEDVEPRQAKMINDVDDVLEVISVVDLNLAQILIHHIWCRLVFDVTV